MKAAVCDDEKVFREEISVLLKMYQKDRRVEIFTDFFKNGTELLESKYNYDVIFMDYQMAGLDGIETCRKLREKNRDSVIIFISAYPAAALDSFEVNTFRFLAKPVDRDKLYKALDDYLNSIDHDNLLLLNTHEGKWSIKTSEIIYLEAAGKHTLVRTSKETYEIHNHLKAIEEMLPPEKFFRCHKAFVVNFAHIVNHTTEEILLDNGEKAYIGKHYSKPFREAFQNYIIRYNRG
ncbi:MAG: response regulator transcription factor [Oscillospiraceae bacterium]|nr:response regulator transcription factor [Oscillospiraceae bacterium]